MCLSVTTITKKTVDKFVPNFTGTFLGGKGKPSSYFVTIGRGMWNSKNSVNRRIVGVASVKCWRQKTQISLSWGVVLSQSTFHLVLCRYQTAYTDSKPEISVLLQNKQVCRQAEI